VSFLLDTNVLSEWTKPRPDAGVVAWLTEADEDRLLISVVSLAELRHGIDRMVPGARRRRLNAWLSRELVDRFEDRIVTIDAAVAEAWGSVVARQEIIGQPIGPMDAFIAATAVVHGLTLVTRNAADFRSTVERIIDPWLAPK
jgi:predicted nucleic acid-binding protein